MDDNHDWFSSPKEKQAETLINNDVEHNSNLFQENDSLINQQKVSEDVEENNNSDVEQTPCEEKSLLQAPSLEHIERLNNPTLILASIQHVLWIMLSALPTVVIVCIIGFSYSKLPWTHKGNSNQINHYFDRWILFWFDDVGRTVSNIFLLLYINVLIYFFIDITIR